MGKWAKTDNDTWVNGVYQIRRRKAQPPMRGHIYDMYCDGRFIGDDLDLYSAKRICNDFIAAELSTPDIW